MGRIPFSQDCEDYMQSYELKSCHKVRIDQCLNSLSSIFSFIPWLLSSTYRLAGIDPGDPAVRRTKCLPFIAYGLVGIDRHKQINKYHMVWMTKRMRKTKQVEEEGGILGCSEASGL